MHDNVNYKIRTSKCTKKLFAADLLLLSRSFSRSKVTTAVNLSVCELSDSNFTLMGDLFLTDNVAATLHIYMHNYWIFFDHVRTCTRRVNMGTPTNGNV